MPRLRAPLFSITASGSIARAITFAHARASQYAKRINRNTTPPSSAQVAHRAAYTDACAAWNLLTPTEKTTWTAAGDARRITAFNAFVSHYLLAPPADTHTRWDAGATTWDAHATLWD